MENNLVRPSLRPLLLGLGWLSFALGVIGAFLPVLPTTPFLILSAYLFSKSSAKLHSWLLDLPTFGPMIRDWETKRVIRPKAKFYALIVLAVVMSSSILFADLKTPLKIMLAAIWISTSAFILTRKSKV